MGEPNEATRRQSSSRGGQAITREPQKGLWRELLSGGPLPGDPGPCAGDSPGGWSGGYRRERGRTRADEGVLAGRRLAGEAISLVRADRGRPWIVDRGPPRGAARTVRGARIRSIKFYRTAPGVARHAARGVGPTPCTTTCGPGPAILRGCWDGAKRFQRT